ncbi:MAG: hypothetical protein HFI82_13570 [Eubacterium sp.]|nr:hypothetical protein [Eubacterium sp.]
MAKINTDEIECSHLLTSTICDVKDFNKMTEKFDASHKCYGRSIFKEEANAPVLYPNPVYNIIVHLFQ